MKLPKLSNLNCLQNYLNRDACGLRGDGRAPSTEHEHEHRAPTLEALGCRWERDGREGETAESTRTEHQPESTSTEHRFRVLEKESHLEEKRERWFWSSRFLNGGDEI
jgi:hypothetical protein